MEKINRFSFNMAYCNLFILSPLYLSINRLNDILPSFILAVFPCVSMLVSIFIRIIKNKKIKKETFILIIIFLFLSLLSLDNEYVYHLIREASFIVMLIFIIFLLEVGEEKLYKDVVLDSIIVIFICVYAQIKGVYVGDSVLIKNSLNYMAYGYTMSVQALVLFECSRNYKSVNKRYITVIATLVAIFSILFGNRAVIVIYFVYFLYNFTLVEKKITLKKIIIFFLIVFVVLLILLNIRNIIIILISFLETINIQSRNLDKMLSNNFLESSNRSIIYMSAINLIKNNPFSVHGPGYLKTQMHSNTNIHLNNANAHNLILELFVEYGIILGTIIFFNIIKYLYKGWKIERKIYDAKNISNKLGMALLIQAITKLMFSSSLYESSELWIGITLIIISEKFSKKYLKLKKQ